MREHTRPRISLTAILRGSVAAPVSAYLLGHRGWMTIDIAHEGSTPIDFA